MKKIVRKLRILQCKIFLLLLVIVASVGLWHVWKPLPAGISVEGSLYSFDSSSVQFLFDHTYMTSEGVRQSDQEIFDAVFAMIVEAREFIVLDMFLFNDFLGTSTTSYRALSDELTEALIAKQQASPDMRIVFITDPVNGVYGGDPSAQIIALQDAGVQVIETDVRALRDSNPLYSGLWRTLLQWWGNSPTGGSLPHVMDVRRDDLTVLTYLRLLNFKANHRKVIVADDGQDSVQTLVTSANPHDGSSAHSNVALQVRESRAVEGIWSDVLRAEQAVVDFSGSDDYKFIDDLLGDQFHVPSESEADHSVNLQLVTEGKIKEALLADIDRSDVGDTIDMALFYISDRDIVTALADAARRGVQIRMILDPNKDAFGREKNGIPNRQVAYEFTAASENISVRWCNTQGEQCHSKLTIFRIGTERTMHIGSANLTRRNIGDYNLEMNVVMRSENDKALAITDADDFFTLLWANGDNKISTLDYEAYADDSVLRKYLYRIMEATGMSSF